MKSEIYNGLLKNKERMPSLLMLQLRGLYSSLKVLQILTLVRHLGYSWSPGRTLNEMGTLSARRLAQKASQIARCTALYTTSKPVKATKAMGRQQSSDGSSHWEPAITTLLLWIHLENSKKITLWLIWLTQFKCRHKLKRT